MERQKGYAMTLDPVSVAVGIVGTYALSGLVIAALCKAVRPARKEQGEAVDQLMARVAVRCIEQPTNARVN